jgi:hypothetical protein
MSTTQTPQARALAHESALQILLSRRNVRDPAMREATRFYVRRHVSAIRALRTLAH